MTGLIALEDQHRFDKVHIEISNVCNLQCSFCPVVERKKGIMELEAFVRILDQVAPLTRQVCLHLMGEPLLHPHLAAMIEACAERQVPVLLVTNGVLLREAKHVALLNPTVRQINFSLHSFRDNFGDQDPSAYLERIFRFTEQALTERPDLYINYRLWNLQDPRGTGAHNLDMLAAIEHRFRVQVGPMQDVRQRKSIRLTQRLYLHFDTEFVWPSLDLPERGTQGRCYGLTTHFGILVDGTVVPCCLDKEGVIQLGNVNSQPLIDILSAPRAQAVLQGFQEGRLVEKLCQRCPYISRFKVGKSKKRRNRLEFPSNHLS
jgi:MoaA/NifB/PqqE/SkfB family radical SAM enzyme